MQSTLAARAKKYKPRQICVTLVDSEQTAQDAMHMLLSCVFPAWMKSQRTWWVRLKGLKGGLVGVQQLSSAVEHEGVQGVALQHDAQVCTAWFWLNGMHHCQLHLVCGGLHPDRLQCMTEAIE